MVAIQNRGSTCQHGLRAGGGGGGGDTEQGDNMSTGSGRGGEGVDTEQRENMSA